MPCKGGICTKGAKMAAPIPQQFLPPQAQQVNQLSPIQGSQFGSQGINYLPVQHKGWIERAKGGLFGKEPEPFTTTPYSQAQQGGFNQALLMALQQLQNPYGGFEPIQENAMSQFYNNIVPTLAERFTAMGEGAQRSSAFPAALAAGGSELQRSLAALRAQYGLQQQGLSQNLLSMGLTPQYQHGFFGETPGFFGGMAQGLGNTAALAGKAALSYATGGLSSAVI